MGKTAKTIDEQIAKLKDRGLIVEDESKAKEQLRDIGYYRLGFYWFPFEKRYPNKNNRDHLFKHGARFDDAISLYYFDSDLRNFLIPFLHRIEINFRTNVIYEVSNLQTQNPIWFADSNVVGAKFAKDMAVFYQDIRRNDAIRRHHNKYPSDVYAPAWKTLEYMTFGNMIYLFESLRDEHIKIKIMGQYGVRNYRAFMSQFRAIRTIRNICAHGHNLFDFKFPYPISPGDIKGMTAVQRSRISGGLIVISRILGSISFDRQKDFLLGLNNLLEKDQFSGIFHLLDGVNVTPKCS